MKHLVKANLYLESKRFSFVFLIIVISFSVIYLFYLSKNIDYSNTLYSVIDGESKYIDKYNYSTLISKEILSNTKYSVTRDIVVNSSPLYYLLGIVFIFKAYYSIRDSSNLLSKVISLVIVLSLYMCLINFLIIVFSCVFGDENILCLTKMIYFNSKFIDVSLVFYLVFKSILYMIPIIFIIMFTFMLSIIFKGKSISLIISVILYLMGSSICVSMISNGYVFPLVLPFSYIDFTYFEGNSYLYNNALYSVDINLFKGIIILLMYEVIFYFISVKLLNKGV